MYLVKNFIATHTSFSPGCVNFHVVALIRLVQHLRGQKALKGVDYITIVPHRQCFLLMVPFVSSFACTLHVRHDSLHRATYRVLRIQNYLLLNFHNLYQSANLTVP